jgi:hypothetical protein
MNPRTPCFFGLWVLLSLLEATRVADGMIEARQTFAKSRSLLPGGNYEDILDLLQEVDDAYTAYDVPYARGMPLREDLCLLSPPISRLKASHVNAGGTLLSF